MRVLLADPPNHHLRGPGGGVQVHPLGLGYLAAAIAPHHDVMQFVPDVRGCSDPGAPWADVAAVLRNVAPDVLGITCVTATFPSAVRLATLARETLGPGCTIVLGGVHATFMPEAAFRCPAIDYVITGEGEETFLALLAALERGEAGAGIPGLLWRGQDGRIERGPPKPVIQDLDALPFPDRERLLWKEALHPAFYQSIITVRGCPYKCIYCSIPATSDRKTRYRSAENIADEIELLRSRYDIPYLFFHDSVFTLSRKRTLALCEAMERRDLVLPFACQTRADRVDEALLQAMKSAGCHQIFFGIESGDVETLTRLKKKMSLETIRRAVTAAKNLGIRCTGFFMMGFPWETEEQLRRTADFSMDLGLDAVSLFSVTPLPGTELWDLSGGMQLPDSIDFRTPQVNLTPLSDSRYVQLFDEVKGAITQYNQGQMMASTLSHWPRG